MKNEMAELGRLLFFYQRLICKMKRLLALKDQLNGMKRHSLEQKK